MVLVQDPVTTTVTVRAIDTGDPIENARAYVVAGSGGPLSSGTVIIQGLTDEDGVIGDTRTLAAPQPVTGWVRRATKQDEIEFSMLDEFVSVTNVLPASAGWTSASFTPKVGSTIVVVAGFEAQDANAAQNATISNTGGLTFTPRVADGETTSTWRMGVTVWTAPVINHVGPMTITIEPNVRVEYRNYQVLQLLRADLFSTAGAIASQYSGESLAAFDITLDAAPDISSLVLSVMMGSVSTAHTGGLVGADFTQIARTELNVAAGRGLLITGYRLNSASTTVDWLERGATTRFIEGWFAGVEIELQSPYTDDRLFRQGPIAGTISNLTGLSLTVQLIPDE